METYKKTQNGWIQNKKEIRTEKSLVNAGVCLSYPVWFGDNKPNRSLTCEYK